LLITVGVDKPYISVIITAYNRKKYLLGAVRSVLNQTLSKDLYEVIVVKNFRDEIIDQELERWGVINLYSDDARQGGALRDALEVARGEVISLLDDDDEFLPEKLGYVYAAFRNGVDYYHNGRVVVNETGKVLRVEGYSALIKGDYEKTKYAVKMVIHSTHGYSSSISFMMAILEGFDLEKCDVSIDECIFTAALLSARVIADDPRPLTLLRVHSQNFAVDLSSFERTQAERLRWALRTFSVSAYLASLLKGTPYERVGKLSYITSKLGYLALPERPQPSDPQMSALRPGDLIEWVSFLPYLWYQPGAFAMRLLTPVFPRALRLAVAKWLFYWRVRQASG
jgi:glycosyltransferase involved in cell wall biosynthesis